MLRRNSPSTAQLTGGDLSVDILHTEDSVQVGDGTNLLGTFPLVGALRSLPVANAEFATNTTLTGGTSKFQIYDPGSADGGVAEVDLVGAERALKVSVISTVGGGGGGTAATDSAAYTATATQFTPTGGAFDDVASDALAEGEMGVVRLTSARAMHVSVQNASLAVTGTFYQATQPVSGTFWQATQPVSGTFWQATQPVSGTVSVTGVATEAKQDTQLTSLQLLDDVVSTFGAAVPLKGNAIAGSDGTLARMIKTDAAGELQVDVLTMPTTAVTGTFWQATQPISGTVTANLAAGTNNIGDVDILSIAAGDNNIGNVDVVTLPSIPAGTNNIGDVDVLTLPAVAGAAAHDAAASGNPIPVGYRAKNTNPTSVADGDITYANADLAGRLVVTFSDRALVTQATGSQATTTEATMLAAGAAGVFHDLTSLILTNSNTTTAAQVQIRDATAGTIRFEHVIPANSGMVVNFPTPLVQTTAANNWTIDLNAAVSTVYYTVQAVKRIA